MPAQIFVPVDVLEDVQVVVKDVTMYAEDAQEVVMERVKESVQLVIMNVKMDALRDVHELVILVQKDVLLDVLVPVRMFALENA